MQDKQVHWPAFVKFAGDSELTFVSDAQQWSNDADLSCYEYEQDDCMVDSVGTVFTLSKSAVEPIVPVKGEDCLSLVEVVNLVREHFSSIGECCVSKIAPRSISEGITMLGNPRN
jgi:hypothetical protein